MELPPPDPQKLLTSWMEWETGETPPGRVMSNLKTAGLPQLLRTLVEQAGIGSSSGAAGQTSSASVGEAASGTAGEASPTSQG